MADALDREALRRRLDELGQQFDEALAKRAEARVIQEGVSLLPRLMDSIQSLQATIAEEARELQKSSLPVPGWALEPMEALPSAFLPRDRAQLAGQLNELAERHDRLQQRLAFLRSVRRVAALSGAAARGPQEMGQFLKSLTEAMRVLSNVDGTSAGGRALVEDGGLMPYWDIVATAVRSPIQEVRLGAVRVLGEVVQGVESPHAMDLLFQALSGKREVVLAASYALLQSPFLGAYLVGDAVGPGCVCAHCFHRFSRQPASTASMTPFWACRFCHGVLHERGVSKVVAVLNNSMAEHSVLEEGILRVNWLDRRELFDFDEVRIGDVDGDSVEDYVMLVRNDTDPLRRSRYGSVTVFLAPNHGLSQSKLNLLKDTFGTLELGTLSRSGKSDAGNG